MKIELDADHLQIKKAIDKIEYAVKHLNDEKYELEAYLRKANGYDYNGAFGRFAFYIDEIEEFLISKENKEALKYLEAIKEMQNFKPWVLTDDITRS